MAYTTLAKVEKYLNTTIAGGDIASVTDWISWVTDYIDNYTGTTFESATGTRYYDGDGLSCLIIEPLTAITQIDFLDEDGAVDETLVSGDYWLYPLNKTEKNEVRLNSYGAHPNYPIGSKRIKIAGTFGWSDSVLSEIEWVATRMVGDIIRQRSEGTKDKISESLGEYSVTFADFDRVNTPDYKVILDRYRMPNI